MKATSENTWESLETPANGRISSRRVGADYPYDFYFSKDTFGKYMLVFSLAKPANINEKILLNGINVANVSAGGSPSITLTLKDNMDWPIFLKICLDMCNIATDASDESKAVGLFCNRLLYWQYFLKRNSENKLSKEEQLGLAGELLFLERYILPQYNALDSINFWTGADADVQDFFIGGKRIEVKACSSPSKNEVHISSLQQLYDAECPIYLVVAYVGVAASDIDGAFSLASLAGGIAERLRGENMAAYELFIKKLAAVGMFLDGTYGDSFYIANKFKGFKVQENFPRITPKDVKEGIIKAKYVVNLGSCKDFEIPLEEAFKKE
jgi:hypothetical protein